MLIANARTSAAIERTDVTAESGRLGVMGGTKVDGVTVTGGVTGGTVTELGVTTSSPVVK